MYSSVLKENKTFVPSVLVLILLFRASLLPLCFFFLFSFFFFSMGAMPNEFAKQERSLLSPLTETKRAYYHINCLTWFFFTDFKTRSLFGMY